jgi:hypothetical protein
LIKLALLRATPQGGAGDLDAALGQHAAWLARLEHRRYVCERMLDGWIRRLASRSGDPAAEAEGRPKLNRYHLNPTLQPFDTLPENERNKDWDIAHLLEVARSSQPASAAASGPPVPAGTAREAAR